VRRQILGASAPNYFVIPTGAGAYATAEWRNLLLLCGVDDSKALS